MQIFIYIGLGFFIISGICVGAFTTGTQQRGNFYSESKQDRKAKKSSELVRFRWSYFISCSWDSLFVVNERTT